MSAPKRDASPVLAAQPEVGDLLARIVDELPVGVAIREVEGNRYVYLNQRALAHERDSSEAADASIAPVLDKETQTVHVHGKAFEVTTLIDNTQHYLREDELTRRAFYDDLTGLPKRDLFERTVNNMIAEGCAPFALSFIDVDNFKYVNDYYGHSVGDQLLKKIARRISDTMRPTDLLARLGGDEFVLLTTPIRSMHEPAAEIEHLARRFREPFFIDGHEIFSSCSIGVSIYPLHGNDYSVIRANADNAMYRVKGSTKGGISLFDATLGHAATERMETEQRLRFAIRDRRIGCAFQPKVNFHTNEILGIEVLMRWVDENGDLRAPGDLIKIAIELGLMDDIAFIILDQVIAQIDLINEAFGVNASISLNIAAKQATDYAFMKKFASALQNSGYAPRFIIELTEEAFLSKGEFQAKILPMLRASGIRVSIDDFGVGYSSLSALAEITADEIKVDRSFINDVHKKPRNQSILKIIEMLGQALGMNIVVEGVETFEELAYLVTSTRITCGQGFFFSKPVVLQPDAPQVGIVERRDQAAQREAGRHRARIGRSRY